MLMVWVLGPMAVVPEYQRRGIGTKLIEAGNRKIKDAGYPFIIVVGRAQYYPRFGSTKRKCRVHLDSRSIGANFDYILCTMSVRVRDALQNIFLPTNQTE